MKRQNYIRKSIHSIEEVLPHTKMDGVKSERNRVDFGGDLIHMASDRYRTFIESGTKCVCCGLQATHFAKETFKGIPTYHFNLYGLNEKGNEILFTKDHIIPKSKGGRNHISNYQTMCCICNSKKGDKII